MALECRGEVALGAEARGECYLGERRVRAGQFAAGELDTLTSDVVADGLAIVPAEHAGLINWIDVRGFRDVRE